MQIGRGLNVASRAACRQARCHAMGCDDPFALTKRFSRPKESTVCDDSDDSTRLNRYANSLRCARPTRN